MADDLVLHVDLTLDSDADIAELDKETTQLRNALLETDVERVDRSSAGPPPPGTRAGEAAMFGALLVQVAPTVIRSLLTQISDWLSRRSSRSCTVTLGDDTISLSNTTSDDQARLIDAFLARHSIT